MKINSINTITFNPYIQQHRVQKQQAPISESRQNEAYMDNVGNINYALLNFNGGASLNLNATVKNLRTLGATLEKSIFPPRVEEKAVQILDAGNPQALKLVDVHQGIFSKIKECSSLDEVKKLFKEERFFDDVKSADEVDFALGSFADRVLNGENEYFSKDEDLSLQLIKLYWGEGFSLTDLKGYTDGKDLNYLLNKFNIPKRNQHYGYYLKLSDEEYNNRITAEMTRKRMETMDRKLAESEGEPIYIPRGPMSDEHKQHISEGLIRYYQENPTACYNISKRQREFYEKHPEQKLIFKEVLTRAWNLKSAEGIKSALRKHLSRSGEKNTSLDFVTDPFSMDSKQKQLMKSFWAMNDWARKSHSKNMQYGWKTVKEDLANPEYFINYPVGFISDVMEFAKTRDVTLNAEDFITEFNKVTKQHRYNPNCIEMLKEYTNDGLNADILAGTYQYSMIQSIRNIVGNATPKNIVSRKKFYEAITKKYHSQIYDIDPKTKRIIQAKDMNIDQARTLFIELQRDFKRYDPDMEIELLSQLSEDYQFIKTEALKTRK